MIPERRLWYVELYAYSRILVKVICVAIAKKVLLIGQTIVIHFAWFTRVNTYRIGHFVQPFEYSVWWREVADSCYHRVSEKLVDGSSAQVVLDTPVR